MKPIIDLGLVQIPTFYFVISLSLIISLLFLSSRVEKNKSFDRKISFDLALVIMFFGFIGARLFHVIYEAPAYYLRYPLQIFQFWNGGFIYFGGMFFSFAAAFIFLKYKKEKFLRWADFMTPVLSLMYALGRLGCFFEGCCYGKKCSLPWSINGQHPTQLYMLLAELVLLYFILKLKSSPNSSSQFGKIFFIWLIGHGVSRLIIEFLRADDRGFMLGNFFSISQVISLIIVALSFYFLKKINHKS